eukprot:11789000-Alexandrium_andersonii.AAC.1
MHTWAEAHAPEIRKAFPSKSTVSKMRFPLDAAWCLCWRDVMNGIFPIGVDAPVDFDSDVAGWHMNLMADSTPVFGRG